MSLDWMECMRTAATVSPINGRIRVHYDEYIREQFRVPGSVTQTAGLNVDDHEPSRAHIIDESN
jgi:hypothetical protein